MQHPWITGFFLYAVFFALTLALRWPLLGQPYRNFEWMTAHSQTIIDNWLENGVWNDRGLSFLNPPSIEFPSLPFRSLYVSYPCGAQVPLFVLAKILGLTVTPGFFHIWGALWHGAIGVALIAGLLLLDRHGREPQRSLCAFLPGFLWLGSRGPRAFFPTLWYADITVLLPFVLVVLAEVIRAHGLLQPRYRRWLSWSVPVLMFWGMYTDWLFLPLCVVLLCYRWCRGSTIRADWLALVGQLIVPVALALTLFCLQLFWVLGSQFVVALRNRFLDRSLDTASAFATQLAILWQIGSNFRDAIGMPTLLLTALAFSGLCLKARTLPNPLKDFVYLLALPSLLLLLIFRQHAAVHQFITVKFMILMAVMLGAVVPRALPMARQAGVLALLSAVFLVYEGWPYTLTADVPLASQAVAWEEGVRKHFGYHDVLFTPEAQFEIPDIPPLQLARSRKRIYPFSADRIATLRRDVPAAHIVVIGTSQAIEALCPATIPLTDVLAYCRL